MFHSHDSPREESSVSGVLFPAFLPEDGEYNEQVSSSKSSWLLPIRPEIQSTLEIGREKKHKKTRAVVQIGDALRAGEI